MENKPKKQRSYLNLFIRRLLSMKEDKAPEEETIASIKAGIDFRGANLWILIFAIFVASLGLNTNSAAVIIGAMLISPLMGPIVGMGLGVGIYDFELLKRAFHACDPSSTHRHYFQCAHGNVLFCHHTHKRSPVRTACPDLTYDLRRAHRALRRTGRHRSLV